MTDVKLTGIRGPATLMPQKCTGRGRQRVMVKTGMIMAGTVALTGCVNVSAPEEPIVIELNINIRADVVYQLAEDAANTIEENADIF